MCKKRDSVSLQKKKIDFPQYVFFFVASDVGCKETRYVQDDIQSKIFGEVTNVCRTRLDNFDGS